MKVFIDFDDVIFNTREFKSDFFSILSNCGISKEIFEKFYEDPKDNRIIKTFNPWTQAERAAKTLEINRQVLDEKINFFLKDISKYVFSDVEEFAKLFGKKSLCLVSFGEKDFQTLKIKNSKISNIIGNILVTETSKAEAIKSFIGNKNFNQKEALFFIDDRIEQINEVKEKFPNMITIFLKRPEGRYQEMKKEKCCDHEAHNLEEATNFIMKKLINESS